MSLYDKYILPHLLNCTCNQKPFIHQRRKVAPLAKGNILEIGIGSGLNIPFYQEQFAYDNFSQNQFEIYKVEYEKEIKDLRKSSIYKGQGLTCLGCVAFTIFMIIGSF